MYNFEAFWLSSLVITVTSPPDDSSDFDNSENEDGGSQFEGVATVGNADPFTPHGFEVDTGDFDETSFTPGPDGEFQVEFVEAPPRTWSGSTSLGSNVNVICTKSGFQITLPAQSPLSSVKVWGMNFLCPFETRTYFCCMHVILLYLIFPVQDQTICCLSWRRLRHVVMKLTLQKTNCTYPSLAAM